MKPLYIFVAGLMIVGLIIATANYYSDQKPLSAPGSQIKRPLPSEQAEPEPLHPILIDDAIGYSLQNDELNITYDGGYSWVTVPVWKERLFAGEYNGNKRELIRNSYILTENRAMFLIGSSIGGGSSKVELVYSLDQGQTWQTSVVSDSYMSIRFRKVEFVNNQFGYVILSGGRTMSQEGSTAFISKDGGATWQATNGPDVTRLIYEGGFVDEKTGFLSYGVINPEEPDFYVTQDGGNSWSKADIHIPDQYDKIFVSAEMPFIEGNHLAVMINQGPNGDYKGGKIKGKFLSTDRGLTWEFSMEVEPNEEQPY